MTTRRDILKGGAGLAAILASGKAPAYLIHSMLAARNGIGVPRGGAPLPYDAEVEYLQSTGTQYIDTGILGHQLYGCEISLVDVATPSYNVFISNVTSNDFCIGVNGGNIKNSYCRIRGTVIWLNTNSASKNISIRNGDVSVGGVSYGTFDDTIPLAANNNEIGLFAKGGGGIPSQCRIMSCKLYGANGALIFDGIPVRVGTTGYMYDKVSKQLFGNAGTGAFLYGGDVYSVPVETSQYVQDGLVAMWDGKENAGVGKRCDTATSWVDLVGNCDFTLMGGAAFSDGSLVLDNINGTQYATASSVSSFPSSDDLTFEVVCDRNNAAVSIFKPPDAYKFGLMFYSPQYNTMGNRISMQTFGDSDFPVGHYGSVSGVYGANNAITIYVDGSAVSLVSSDSIGGSQNEATIGRRLSGNAYGLTGRVSCIRIYNRALTAVEIAANCAIDKARFNLPQASQ